MVPLLTIMDRGKLWEKEGIDVIDYKWEPDPINAEEVLLDEGIDFIFGNHVSPYMRLARGHPMVCLAQTENWMHLWVATDPSIAELRMLGGRRVVGRPLFLENGKFCGHADGNRILLLELQGVDTRTVEFVSAESVGNPVQAVRDGKADACFVSPERVERAQAAGLRVHHLPPMPMVHSITFTTTTPRLAQGDEDFGERIMRVLVDATHFLKTRKEETLELMKDPIDTFYEGQLERFAADYEQTAAEYETKLFPRAEALINVHKLSCMVYPEARTVNPLELWDNSLLRKLYASGYVDNLYGGRQAVTADVIRTLDHGQCEAC